MISLDTSAIIDLFRNNPSLVKFLAELEDTVVLTQISYLELMFGLNFESASHKSEEEFYDILFNNYEVLNIDKTSSKKAGKISMQLKKSGITIEAFDCAIAGILLAHGVTKILTKNKKHFEHIKELNVVSY